PPGRSAPRPHSPACRRPRTAPRTPSSDSATASTWGCSSGEVSPARPLRPAPASRRGAVGLRRRPVQPVAVHEAARGPRETSMSASAACPLPNPASAVHRASSRHRVDAYGLSDQGSMRATNQDAYTLLSHLGLYAVADGVGGGRAGDVASRMAVDSV